MEDQQIIALYFQRQEQAIQETDRKYGRLCHGIAVNVLSDRPPGPCRSGRSCAASPGIWP